jgi:cytochrome c oxidase assembly protein subunit 11
MNRNRAVMGALFGVAFAMVGLTFASVPLYKVFCRVTGFGGTTQRAAEAAKTTANRTIEIRFNTAVDLGLPWDFKPNQRSVTLKVGETGMATFHAHNFSGVPIVGTAVYNVTPEKAGLYFDKIQCFCFTEQHLGPHESAEWPVVFFLDPALETDASMARVDSITLSYTLFAPPSERPAPARAADRAGPAG